MRSILSPRTLSDPNKVLRALTSERSFLLTKSLSVVVTVKSRKAGSAALYQAQLIGPLDENLDTVDRMVILMLIICFGEPLEDGFKKV